MKPPRSPKAKAALAFLLVFLLGGGTGYVAGYWQAMASPWEAGWGGWRGWRARGARGEDRYTSRTERFLQRLERDLKLTGEQSKQAGDILRRHHERFLALRREMDPRVEGMLNEIRTELRSLMTPAQREHFDQMVQMMEQHRRRWHERRGSPGRGMGGMMGGPSRP